MVKWLIQIVRIFTCPTVQTIWALNFCICFSLSQQHKVKCVHTFTKVSRNLYCNILPYIKFFCLDTCQINTKGSQMSDCYFVLKLFMYVHTYTYVPFTVYIYVCMYVYICTQVCIHIHRWWGKSTTVNNDSVVEVEEQHQDDNVQPAKKRRRYYLYTYILCVSTGCIVYVLQ